MRVFFLQRRLSGRCWTTLTFCPSPACRHTLYAAEMSKLTHTWRNCSALTPCRGQMSPLKRFRFNRKTSERNITCFFLFVCRHFRLYLRTNDQLFTEDFRAVIIDEDGQERKIPVNRHNYFTGHVIGNLRQSSSVKTTACFFFMSVCFTRGQRYDSSAFLRLFVLKSELPGKNRSNKTVS